MRNPSPTPGGTETPSAIAEPVPPYLADVMKSFGDGRCYACGWHLENFGCMPFNCSYRPSENHPEHARWLERASQMSAVFAWANGARYIPSQSERMPNIVGIKPDNAHQDGQTTYACQTPKGCHGRPQCEHGCEGIAARNRIASAIERKEGNGN